MISAFLIVTLAGVVITNLPQSNLRRHALRVAEPYLNAIGLDQSWALFAPDPRRFSIALRARVLYEDGSAETWRPPAGGALFDSYWDYHWQKWQEWVLDAGERRLWRPAAEFIARDSAGRTRRPVRVTLFRLTSLNNPPGRHPDHKPVVSRAYYSLRITPTVLARGAPR